MKFGLMISQILLTIFFGLLVGKANAATISDITQELNLSPAAAVEVEAAVASIPIPAEKGKVLFCVEIGGSAFFDAFVMSCKNLRGRRYNITFLGLGPSLSLHSGVAILYPKKGSRLLKDGTYRNNDFRAIHLGLGILGVNFSNDNASINYRIRGLSIGAGMNVAGGLVLVEDLNSRKAQ